MIYQLYLHELSTEVVRNLICWIQVELDNPSKDNDYQNHSFMLQCQYIFRSLVQISERVSTSMVFFPDEFTECQMSQTYWKPLLKVDVWHASVELIPEKYYTAFAITKTKLFLSIPTRYCQIKSSKKKILNVMQWNPQ